MKLVKATIADAKAIKDLAYAIWPTAYQEILSEAQLLYMLTLFYNEAALKEQMLVKNQQFYLVQDENGRNMGFVAYEINALPQKTKIHKIYVLPNQQGLGLGKLLYNLVKEKAIEAKQKAVFLNVNKYNKALHFYNKLGFTIVKEEVIDIGNEYVMDDFVMEVGL
jgi:ribosomal protein S18 acetylase RimI-like enzyme